CIHIAGALHRDDDYYTYSSLSVEIQQAFLDRFWNPDLKQIGTGSQCSNAVAVAMHLLYEPEHFTAAARGLEDSIIRQYNGHLYTGIHGCKSVLEALSRRNLDETAYTAVTQTTPPSWGYWLSTGASTLLNGWLSRADEGGGSKNHVMWGSVGAWLYHRVLGIRYSAYRYGFACAQIRPGVMGDLTWARGWNDTIYGRLSCAWERTADGLDLQVTLPPGMYGQITIPTLGMHNPELYEGSHLIWLKRTRFIHSAAGVQHCSLQDGDLSVGTSSGTYNFHLKGQDKA
ncbi:MAG: alpha-L-rhamnosidase-related protein, partial [Anaerolineae bacterium]